MIRSLVIVAALFSVSAAFNASNGTEFCDTFKEKCPEDLSFRNSVEYCAAVYDSLPEGVVNSTTGATRACLAYHLNAVSNTSSVNHCPHAGGAAPCGVTLADAFCGAYSGLCDPPTGFYGSTAACMATFNALPTGTAGDVSGATQECLNYHLVAAVADSNTHCPHAAGASPCDVPAATEFCASYTAICPNDASYQNNEVICKAAFNSLPVGTDADVAGATQGCLNYHLKAAVDNNTTHCPHAGGQAPCDLNTSMIFCAAFMDICPTDSSYGNMSACITSFESLPTGSPGDVTGATQACLEYHLKAAVDNNTTHCPHAGGSAVCVPPPTTASPVGSPTVPPTSGAGDIAKSFVLLAMVVVSTMFML